MHVNHGDGGSIRWIARITLVWLVYPKAAVRDVQVHSVERFERLLLVLAVAYLLLIGLGYYARQYYCPSTWSTTSRPGQASAFSIGRAVWHRLRASPEQVFNALIAILKEPSKNWG